MLNTGGTSDSSGYEKMIWMGSRVKWGGIWGEKNFQFFVLVLLRQDTSF